MNTARHGGRAAGLAATCALVLVAGFAGCAKQDAARAPGAVGAATDSAGQVRFERVLGAPGDTVVGYARYVLVAPPPDRVPGVSALAESLRTALAWAIGEGEAGTDGRPLPADSLAARFLEGYRSFRADFPGARQEWTIEREIALETLPFGLSTIRMQDVRFTGGAHGAANTFYRSYDPQSGAQLRLGDLADAAGLDSLRVIGEAAFRVERQVPAGTSLQQAGFFVWDDSSFALSENFGVTHAGLVFQYNAYDVAPYALGPTTITLPWDAVRPHLRADGPLKMAK